MKARKMIMLMVVLLIMLTALQARAAIVKPYLEPGQHYVRYGLDNSGDLLKEGEKGIGTHLYNPDIYLLSMDNEITENEKAAQAEAKRIAVLFVVSSHVFAPSSSA